MAKYGEGDKRWIVEERPDGTNVHNWHWTEKDCMPWAKKRLGELLENLAIMEGSGGIWITTTKIDSVTGEAYVNIRKGKIIPGYELTVKISWKGEAKDGEGNLLAEVKGKVELPYIADENSDEDPELKVSVLDETPVGKRIREAFLATGKSLVLEKIRVFVSEMKKGGPAKEELEGKTVTKTQPEAPNNANLASTANNQSPAKQQTPPKPKDKEGFKTITLTEKFHCRPRDLYSTLMDENRWKGFTQSKAIISREVGGKFSIFDGAVTGVNLQLEEDKLIVQKWRFQSWNDDHYSTVTMTFEEPEIGVTVVKLTQTGVPEEDRFGNATVIENTQKGWKDLIFHKIRAVFGYGI